MKTLMAKHPAGAETGARTLYLGHGEHKRVSCTAQALVVSNEKLQLMRYPIARVARIVSNAEAVDWSGAALALCMREGIAITWLDVQGNALGAVYPAYSNQASFAAALELMLESAEGLERYQNWLRARRMDVLKRWGQGCRETPTPQQWETAKRDWVYGGRFMLHLPTALRGHCMAFVAAQLAANHLPPKLWGPDAELISLLDNLCELLWAEMNMVNGSLADRTGAEQELALLFERWNACNASALLLHINSLCRTAMKELFA